MLLLLVILVLASLLFALLTYWLGQRVLSAAIGLAYPVVLGMALRG